MPGQEDPWPQVDGRGRLLRAIARGSGEGDPTGVIDDQQPVGLVGRSAVVERRQQAAAERERRAQGQVHARQASRRSTSPTVDLPRTKKDPDRSIRVVGTVVRAQRFLPRTSMRWAVHSEPARSIVAELPCQPHVQVIV